MPVPIWRSYHPIGISPCPQPTSFARRRASPGQPLRPRHRPRQSNRPVGGDRPFALRQDGFHFLARAQSAARRAPAVVRTGAVGPRLGRPPGTAARRRRTALPVRGPHSRPGEEQRLAGFDPGDFELRITPRLSERQRLEPASSRPAASRSISSTIPANGCSICRCSRRTIGTFSEETARASPAPVSAAELSSAAGSPPTALVDQTRTADEMLRARPRRPPSPAI